ncbi:MAG: hypothetical protein WDN76_09845 [Alphaproteobacteria bacterium]
MLVIVDVADLARLDRVIANEAQASPVQGGDAIARMFLHNDVADEAGAVFL